MPPDAVTERDRAVTAVRALARTTRLLERSAGTLGLAHFRVLSAVAGGAARASRVAERLALGRPSVSAAVESLCQQGYLTRSSAAGDLRAVDLRLTGAGELALAEVEDRLVGVLDELCRRSADGPSLLAALASLDPLLDELADDRLRERHKATRAGG